MTVIELIEILKQKLKENGNVDVKLWDNSQFCDFSIEHSTDIVDISNRGDISEYVPVPLLKIEKEQ